MSSARRRIHKAALRLFAERGNSQISISDLAQEAGLARGTIYNNVDEPGDLFERIAAELADEMYERIDGCLSAVDDPAERIAGAVRLFMRQAHEEPIWARFLLRFAFSSSALRGMLVGPPRDDLVKGLDSERFHFREEQIPSVLMMIGGATVSGMLLVQEGLKTWRDAGVDIVEILLIGLGVPIDEARRLATQELPRFPDR